MVEGLVLAVFGAGLIVCVVTDVSVLYALGAGLVLFLGYGLARGYALRALTVSCLEGVSKAANILMVFLLVGILTALWRAAGTIPVIVSFSAGMIRPSVYLLMTFWLNCVVSVLTGTSFGTSATMGVICAAIGRSLGVDIRLIGGAVLAGAFFGDRCSPVSTSALLVAQVTHTDIYRNIPGMIRTALVPFAASSALYVLLGFAFVKDGDIPDLSAMFAGSFSLHWSAVLPAVVILLLALMHVHVKLAMTASILTAVPLCLFLQHMSLGQLLSAAVFGYRPADPALTDLIGGGGVLSMLRVAEIVCISSCYAGLFRLTGMLDGPQKGIERFAARTNAFSAVLLTSVLTGMIACNQTLSIMLTSAMCEKVQPEPEKLALDLEDSVVVTAVLIPWSIAGAVPLASVDAPATAILFAFFLYLLPMWRLATSRKRSADGMDKSFVSCERHWI